MKKKNAEEKYVSFRISTFRITPYKIIRGWFVDGQRDTDYEWEMLYEASSREDAIEYIRGIRESEKQIVYGPGGYGIKI